MDSGFFGLKFLRRGKPPSEPTMKLLPVSREPVYTTEKVGETRPDGSWVAQRYRDGIPEGPPVEVGSISGLIKATNERRHEDEVRERQRAL